MTQFAKPNFSGVFTSGGTQISETEKVLIQELADSAENLQGILDKGISLDHNVDCDIVSYTSNVTHDVEDAVAHSLGKVPVHFTVTHLNKGAVIYASATPATDTHIYLKSTIGSTTVKIILQ